MANPNDLSTNIVINVGDQQQQPSEKNDGRKLNRGSGRGKLSENIHKVNFKSIAKLGLGIRTLRMANEMVGAYTGDKITQRRVTTAMTFTQYGIGIARLGGMGAFYAAADIGFRAFNQTNQVMIDNQMARYIKDLSGNNARNQSRSSGEKL
jgi:hypothetical protein